ncbi:MAG: hypothetical protein ABIF71_09305 [Planctomycetota bacterium]
MKKFNSARYLFVIALFSLSLPVFGGSTGPMNLDFQVGASVNFDTDINFDPELIENSTDLDDMRITLNGSANYVPFKFGNQSIGFGLDVGMNSYQEETDYSNDSIAARTSYRINNLFNKFTFNLDAIYSNYNVDGDAYLYNVTLYPTLFWPHNDQFTSVFKLRLREQTYYNRDAASGSDMGLEFKEIWQISAEQELGGGIFLNQCALDAGELSYTGMRLNVDYTWRFMKDLELNAAMSVGTKSFVDDSPGEGDPRSESFLVAAMSVGYDLGKWGRAYVGAQTSSNSSNVDDFDVDHSTITAGYIYGMEF